MGRWICSGWICWGWGWLAQGPVLLLPSWSPGLPGACSHPGGTGSCSAGSEACGVLGMGSSVYPQKQPEMIIPYYFCRNGFLLVHI